jgi:L-ascorbate metabolism protein UlaG (beta-lactamase superfamily)
MTLLRLRRDVNVRVDYDDRTAFGSPTTMRAQKSTRQLFAPVFEHVRQYGFDDLLREAPRLLREVVVGDGFAKIGEPDGRGAWRVDPAVLYPDPEQARPRWLALEPAAGTESLRMALADDDWPWVHRLIAELASGGWNDEEPDADPMSGDLVELMRTQGLLSDTVPDEHRPRTARGSDLTFLGHNTVVVQAGATRVIVDPLFFADGPGYPASYQPLGLSDIGPVDAVLITHSHPDHFDPASLLRFPPDTPVIVPVVARETLLATAMTRRLDELGFADIRPLTWGNSIRIGDAEVTALPFYGEQPTDGDVLHPDVRNAGNTYVVTGPTCSAGFLADSGRDHLGDVREVVADRRRAGGELDVLFSGYRGWVTYPVQLLFSSVAAFLLLVPPRLWTVRQQLMCDVTGAVDVAEHAGARYVVPYADGGAPWHWEVGLGPRLDGGGVEDVDFDPYPERVVAAATQRVRLPDAGWLASPVRPLLLRPGDALADIAGTARVERRPGHAWPYGA